MGFQETFNERVMPAANRAFGITASIEGREIIVQLGRRSLPSEGRPQGIDPAARLRFQEFVIATDQLEVDDRVLLPESGMQIEVADLHGEPRAWVAFPLSGGLPYRFFDHTEKRLRLFGVDQRDLVKFCYTRPDGSQTEIYWGIGGPISIDETFAAVPGIGGVSTANEMQRQTVSLIPKASQFEIVDSGSVQMQQPDSETLDAWTIDKISSSTPSLITVDMRRPSRKRGPESRLQQ